MTLLRLLWPNTKTTYKRAFALFTALSLEDEFMINIIRKFLYWACYGWKISVTVYSREYKLCPAHKKQAYYGEGSIHTHRRDSFLMLCRCIIVNRNNIPRNSTIPAFLWNDNKLFEKNCTTELYSTTVSLNFEFSVPRSYNLTVQCSMWTILFGDLTFSFSIFCLCQQK